MLDEARTPNCHNGNGNGSGQVHQRQHSAHNRYLMETACIVLTCIACYYNSAQCGLVFDDISAIRDNKDLRPQTPVYHIFMNDFWGTPMRKEQSHKSYRPLTVLTFRFNYWLHQLAPAGYHVVNVLLHIAVCLLWRRVSWILLTECANAAIRRSSPTKSPKSATTNVPFSSMCSFVASLLFAVHPIHTEAVTGIVGRAELLSSIFFLVAFLVYWKASTTAVLQLRGRNRSCGYWLNFSMKFTTCLLISMLCKEQGITVAGICAIFDVLVVNKVQIADALGRFKKYFEYNRLWCSLSENYTPGTLVEWLRKTRSLHRLGFITAITSALLMARLNVMGSQLPVFTRFDNPAAAAATPARQLTYSYLVFLNFRLLLFPYDLCCDWTMGTIPLVEHVLDVRNIGTMLVFGFIMATCLYCCLTQNTQQAHVLIMCLAWMILPFLPASNLFFPVGFVVAERVLYMPSMGYCLLIAYGYCALGQRLSGVKSASLCRSVWKLGMLLLLITYGLKTLQRNYDWRTEYSLFMSGIHVNNRNAKLFNNVGHALEGEERYLEALQYFEEAARIQPDDIGAHINIGRTYNNLKMYDKAEAAYRQAKALFPQIKPGASYQTRIAPNYLNVFINLATLIAKNQTRLEEADYLYRQAISMRSDYVQAYINRGDILMKMNRTEQAQEVYEKALLYDSDNADIYYNLGVVFLEQGKSAQALAYFNKAIDLFPEHEQALLNSAILLQDIGGESARQLSRERLYKVLEKDDSNEKVFFNLGMLSMDESKFEDAENFFKRAIHLKTDFRSALFNLALLLADANRPLEAVPYLNQLIRHYPNHIKGLILLGDININHIRDLDAAEQIYRNILKYDPTNIQGMHNLCVVYVERKQLLKAEACFRYAHHLAPHEDYIVKHLNIVSTRLQKLMKLPKDSSERQLAFAAFDEFEARIFRISTGDHADAAPNSNVA